MTALIFDTLRYATQLKEAGFTDVQVQKQTNALADAFEQAETRWPEVKDIATGTQLNALQLSHNEFALKTNLAIEELKKETQALRLEVESVKKETQALKLEIESSKKETQALRVDVESVKKEIQLLRLEIRDVELRLTNKINDISDKFSKSLLQHTTWTIGTIVAFISIAVAVIKLL